MTIVCMKRTLNPYLNPLIIPFKILNNSISQESYIIKCIYSNLIYQFSAHLINITMNDTTLSEHLSTSRES